MRQKEEERDYRYGKGLAHTSLEATYTISAAFKPPLPTKPVRVHLFKVVHRRQNIRNYDILML